MSGFKVAYFINQYPKVSHSFIRREILALERQGFEVQRIALRGWDGDAVDSEDLQERDKTSYVLQDGIWSLLASTFSMLLNRPRQFLQALRQALKMSHRTDRPWPFHLVYLAEACRIVPWMQSFGASHVHAHFGTNSAEVVMLARFLGGPAYSFTVHGPEEFDKPQFLKLREKVRHAAFVVAISSYGRSQLYRWVDFADWDKVKLVHCGLEPAFHENQQVPVTDAPRLVCVGRLCEQKGQLLLVHAVSRLMLSGIDVQLVLAGDGEMRGEIEALLRQSALQHCVHITGWISSEQVREQILAARALILPSFAEGLPVVIMEAMALRRPVLSTYVAGIPELVRPGEGGWLIPAGDIEALTEALKQVLAAPREELERMGILAHARVLRDHSIDTEAARLGRYFMNTAGAEFSFAEP
ncbi:MAG: colanic acid biosynthesis glycosyltransferase WcaL [Betaproteobacteria bacterium HGW-Betaproteobacteria-1]|jgi:glycosyltransferase involved in cell wall biosynthesis|nr:MAG: colanic acid biosynthesis glycosyltransferase WcaL [Betaproteobacteria bacterium HGW-Betaproteobacteria-1]